MSPDPAYSCPHCGKDVEAKKRFCHHCGKALNAREQITPTGMADSVPQEDGLLTGSRVGEKWLGFALGLLSLTVSATIIYFSTAGSLPKEQRTFAMVLALALPVGGTFLLWLRYRALAQAYGITCLVLYQLAPVLFFLGVLTRCIWGLSHSGG